MNIKLSKKQSKVFADAMRRDAVVPRGMRKAEKNRQRLISHSEE